MMHTCWQHYPLSSVSPFAKYFKFFLEEHSFPPKRNSRHNPHIQRDKSKTVLAEAAKWEWG